MERKTTTDGQNLIFFFFFFFVVVVDIFEIQLLMHIKLFNQPNYWKAINNKPLQRLLLLHIVLLPNAVLKITTSQWSLIVTTAFVTAEKLRQMGIITANTQMRQQLLITTITIFANLLKSSLSYFVIGRLSRPNM